MIRLVLGEGGALGVDLSARAFGRGAWVHPRPDCLSRAARGGAERGLKAKVTTTEAELFQEVRAAASRRVQGLLHSARGAGKVAPGSDAAEAAEQRGEVALLLVASDARSSAQAAFVGRLASRGGCTVWGTKDELGRAVSRPDTALVAVLDKGFADAIVRAVSLSEMPDGGLEGAVAARAVSEVR